MNYKIFIVSLLLMFAFLPGCNKKEIDTIPTENQKAYSVKNGVVHFSSFASYRNFLEAGSEKQKLDLVTDLRSRKDYTPLYKDPSHLRSTLASRLLLTGQGTDDDVDDLLSSDFLSSIVNSDGIVQIGNYFFNVNLITEKCYAIHSSWVTIPYSENLYYDNLLNENTQNLYIFDFTTDDDVLDILEDLGNPTVKNSNTATYANKRCGETGVPKKKVKGTEYFPKYDQYTQDRLEIKVVYQKAGFYFSLLGKLQFKSGGQGDWQSRRDYFVWRFKPKCKLERIQPYTTTFATNAANGYKKFAYEDTRGLTKYDVSFQWQIKGHATTSNSLLTTHIYAIKAGY